MAVIGTKTMQEVVETMILMSSLPQIFAALVAVEKLFKKSMTITMVKSPTGGVTIVQITPITQVGAVNTIMTFGNQLRCAQSVEVEPLHGLENDDLTDLERSR